MSEMENSSRQRMSLSATLPQRPNLAKGDDSPTAPAHADGPNPARETAKKPRKLAENAPQNFGLLAAMDTSTPSTARSGPALKARTAGRALGASTRLDRSVRTERPGATVFIQDMLVSDPVEELCELLTRLGMAADDATASALVLDVSQLVERLHHGSCGARCQIALDVVQEFEGRGIDAFEGAAAQDSEKARRLRAQIMDAVGLIQEQTEAMGASVLRRDISHMESMESGLFLRMPEEFATEVFAHPKLGLVTSPTNALASIPCFQEPRDMPMLLHRALEAYRSFDIDNTGLTTEEVGAVLVTLGCRMPLHEVQALVDDLAPDPAARIGCEEFVSFVLLNNEALGMCAEHSVVGRVKAALQQYLPSGSRAESNAAQDARQGRMAQSSAKKLKLWLPDSPWRRRWDMFMMVFILAMVVLLPAHSIVYEMRPYGWKWALEGAMQFVLTADAVIFLNTCQPMEGGRIVTTRVGVLALHWPTVTVDAVAALPLDFVGAAAAAPLYVFLAFRALRLVKVAKIKRFFQRSKRLPMDRSYVLFFFQALPLYMMCFWVLVGVHWMVLLKVRIAPARDLNSGRSVPEVLEAWCSELFWVWTILCSAPASLPLDSSLEKIYAGLLMGVALGVQGIVVGKMSMLVLKEDVQQQTAERMRDTHAVLTHFRLPTQLQSEIMSYQYHTLTHSTDAFITELVTLPLSMLRELEVYMKMSMVSAVKLFARAGHVCKICLVNALLQSEAPPDEYIITAGDEGREMYFLVYGFADVILTNPPGLIVATLTGGDSFGEIALLSPDCKRTAHVKALTHCSLLRLEKSDFIRILQDFSEFRAIVHMEMKSRGMSDEQRRLLMQGKYEDPAAPPSDHPAAEDVTLPLPAVAEAEGDQPAGPTAWVHQQAPRLSFESASTKLSGVPRKHSPSQESVPPLGSSGARRTSAASSAASAYSAAQPQKQQETDVTGLQSALAALRRSRAEARMSTVVPAAGGVPTGGSGAPDNDGCTQLSPAAVSCAPLVPADHVVRALCSIRAKAKRLAMVGAARLDEMAAAVRRAQATAEARTPRDAPRWSAASEAAPTLVATIRAKEAAKTETASQKLLTALQAPRRPPDPRPSACSSASSLWTRSGEAHSRASFATAAPRTPTGRLASRSAASPETPASPRAGSGRQRGSEAPGFPRGSGRLSAAQHRSGFFGGATHGAAAGSWGLGAVAGSSKQLASPRVVSGRLRRPVSVVHPG
eukprot:TRINITY_DN9309_c0_g2_i1.p1 TRINITY_DN9309_c0_g2~~TRINITY_DN9309_c0_g2_i1.p1  ORF type:complete len:1224 (+),score=197.54 TRINITY_DN9309_c0_g2_i1:106-3777(+)